MKKEFITLGIVFLFSISFAAAAYNANTSMGGNNRVANISRDGNNVTMNGNHINVPTLYRTARKMIKEKDQLKLKSGKIVNFSKIGNKLMIRSGNLSANCENCNLSQSNNSLHAKMSNGRNAEIKIMPDEASRRAIERLQLKNCPEETCKIELKEVGSGNESRMAYQVKSRARAKIFGIFNTNVNAEVQIDAETGEVIKMNKPWWAKIIPTEDAE